MCPAVPEAADTLGMRAEIPVKRTWELEDNMNSLKWFEIIKHLHKMKFYM